MAVLPHFSESALKIHRPLRIHELYSRTYIFSNQKSEREIVDLSAALHSFALRWTAYPIHRLDLGAPRRSEGSRMTGGSHGLILRDSVLDGSIAVLEKSS
jgi:hypothetical protein